MKDCNCPRGQCIHDTLAIEHFEGMRHAQRSAGGSGVAVIEVPAQRFERACSVCGKREECDAEDLMTVCERDVVESCETF